MTTAIIARARFLTVRTQYADRFARCRCDKILPRGAKATGPPLRSRRSARVCSERSFVPSRQSASETRPQPRFSYSKPPPTSISYQGPLGRGWKRTVGAVRGLNPGSNPPPTSFFVRETAPNLDFLPGVDVAWRKFEVGGGFAMGRVRHATAPPGAARSPQKRNGCLPASWRAGLILAKDAPGGRRACRTRPQGIGEGRQRNRIATTPCQPINMLGVSSNTCFTANTRNSPCEAWLFRYNTSLRKRKSAAFLGSSIGRASGC